MPWSISDKSQCFFPEISNSWISKENFYQGLKALQLSCWKTFIVPLTPAKLMPNALVQFMSTAQIKQKLLCKNTIVSLVAKSKNYT